jgi:outer membrane protein assembly factor BamB
MSPLAARPTSRRAALALGALGLAAALAALTSAAPERAAFGSGAGRNMVSGERGLAASWDLASGRDVRWVAELGSETYAGPVVAGGQVLVGTNNQHPRDPQAAGDRGVLMAFAAADGRFLWQASHPKLPSASQDWPLAGLCSTPAVEGDRVYYLSNRGEVVALAGRGARLWTLDLVRALGVVPHFMTSSSPLLDGDLLFAVTANGSDAEGRVPAPRAPSFIAVDRRTGKLRWSDASPGDGLLDGQWGSPALGVVGGRPQVIFPGGDGRLYAFAPESGRRLWSFDANLPAAAGGRSSRAALVATPVVAEGRIYAALGHDPQRAPDEGRLWALAPAADGGGVAPVWSAGGAAFGTTLSTVAVGGGIVYAADFAGFLHAFDAATGRELWKYDTQAAIWGSPLLADGRIYLGDEDGDLLVLAAGREARLLFKGNLGSAIYTTPAARDGVLYVATRSRLFALAAAPAWRP